MFRIIIRSISAICVAMIAFSNSLYAAEMNKYISAPFVELGLFTTKFANKTNHLEATDTTLDSDVYIKRKLKNNSGAYFSLGFKTVNNLGVELEYINAFDKKFSGVTSLTDSGSPSSETSTFSTNIRYQTFLLNLNYYFNSYKKITPFIGGGLGFSINRISSESIDYSNTNLNPDFINKKATYNNFAWSINLGSRFNISDNLYIKGMYKFIGLGKFKGVTEVFDVDSNAFATQDISFKNKMHSHMFILSLGYNF